MKKTFAAIVKRTEAWDHSREAHEQADRALVLLVDGAVEAVEDLGARGRMVGLVTHVREMAERVPVRFEVRKVGGNSTVTRVAA